MSRNEAPRGVLGALDLQRTAMHYRGTLTFSLGVLIACAPAKRQRPAQDHTVRVSEAAYHAMPRYTLTLRTPLCSDTHADECLFRDMEIAFAGPHGRAYLGGMGERLREFDSAGAFARYIGGSGEGPGEYRLLAGGGADSAGDVMIFDMRLFRLTSYAPDGTVLGTATVDTTPVGLTSWRVVGRNIVFFILPPAASTGDSVQAAFLEVGADGRPGSILRSFHARALFATMRKHVVSAADPVQPPPLFTPSPSWDANASGSILFASGDRFAVTRYDPGMSKPFELVVGVEPHRVTSTDVDREVAYLNRSNASMPPVMQKAWDASVARQARDAAKDFPMVAKVRLLDDGTVVIREWTTHDAPRARWDLFDSTGHGLAYLDLPAGTRIAAGDLHRLLVVSHDSDGVAHAGWYRLAVQ